jgi:hypothetical protein
MLLEIGDIVTVHKCNASSISLEGYGTSSFFEENFELDEDTSKHHKHHDLIIAWAKGAEIEFLEEYHDSEKWYKVVAPIWQIDRQYRIKPTASPEQIEKESIIEEMQKLKERLDKLDVK